MKTSPFLVGVSVVTLVAAGCSNPNASQTDGGTPSTPAAAGTPRSQADIYVVNHKATRNQDPLTVQSVPLHKSQTPARDAVEALLQSPDSPLVHGTVLRGITIDSGVATLDFSQSPLNQTGGEGPQSDALAALSRTLGQFSEIRQFQIEVQGRPLTSFGEQGTLSGPIDVVRPVEVAKP